jgi:hypothetical protein
MKKITLLACILFATQFVYSQEAITVSGGDVIGPEGSGTYSVGQTFYTTNTAATGSVSQGVQQPFEFQILSNPELTTVNLTAITYPNPTKDFIILKVSQKNKTFKILKHQ